MAELAVGKSASTVENVHVEINSLDVGNFLETAYLIFKLVNR
jgi:hypothetical protein